MRNNEIIEILQDGEREAEQKRHCLQSRTRFTFGATRAGIRERNEASSQGPQGPQGPQGSDAHARRTFPIAGFQEFHECACGYRSTDNRDRRCQMRTCPIYSRCTRADLPSRDMQDRMAFISINNNGVQKSSTCVNVCSLFGQTLNIKVTLFYALYF